MARLKPRPDTKHNEGGVHCHSQVPKCEGPGAPGGLGIEQDMSADSVRVKTLTYQTRWLISKNLQGFNGPF